VPLHRRLAVCVVLVQKLIDSCQINSHRSHLTFESVFCWSCCCLLAATLCCLLTNLHLAGIPPLLNLALLFLLDSAVDCVEFACCCCPTPLLVWFDLAVSVAGSKCGFLVDSDPCSCWIGFLLCWTFVGPLFGWLLVKFCFCFDSWFVGVAPLSFSDGDQLNNLHWLLVWFFWSHLVYFATFLCPSCVDLFSWLGVQGGHSFEPIYWLFAVVNVSALSLIFPQTLVSCSSCLPRLL